MVESRCRVESESRYEHVARKSRESRSEDSRTKTGGWWGEKEFFLEKTYALKSFGILADVGCERTRLRLRHFWRVRWRSISLGHCFGSRVAISARSDALRGRL